MGGDGLGHRAAVPECSMGAKRDGPLNWELRGTLPPSQASAPGGNVVTAIPRKTLSPLDGRRRHSVSLLWDTPKGAEACLEVVEEGVGLWTRRRGCTQAVGGCDVGLVELRQGGV